MFDHPSWGRDFPGAGRGAELVALEGLFDLPLGELSRLFIDDSNHPSQVGYLFLTALIRDRIGVRPAFDRARTAFEADLLAKFLRLVNNKPLLVAGDSIWIDILRRTLGASGLKRFEAQNIHIRATQLWREGPQPGAYQHFLFVSHHPTPEAFLEATPRLKAAFEAGAPPAQIAYFPWESSISQLFTTTKFTSPRAVEPAPEELITESFGCALTGLRELIEIGLRGEPNGRGLAHVIERAGEIFAAPLPAGQAVQPAEGAAHGMSWKMDNGVLVTSRGMAFLIAGGHRVLDYITGKATPTAQSLANFEANIAGRAQLAARIGAPYLHVIFPDKQSVLREEFPVRPLNSLGETYLAALDPALRGAVLFPAERLREDCAEPYCPLDTHLTDHGSLTVLREMLARLGVAAEPALDAIEARITRDLISTGDLGSKLTPPRKQSMKKLVPGWPYRGFHGFTAANDGAVDIVISPEAPVQKTVLIFGDSFFRLMLAHLSGVFGRVVCLRTRFLHPEMVELIRPDLLLSGNAERYLSAVTADTEAHGFALYPLLKGLSAEAVTPEFLEAYRAILSPRSEFAQSYFETLHAALVGTA